MNAIPLTPSTAASRIWKLLREIFGHQLPIAIDLKVVHELLNQPAFGKGEILKKPIAFDAENFEGALVRNADRHDEWGIFYKPRPKCSERERFTIAHEIGHFVLHREGRERFPRTTPRRPRRRIKRSTVQRATEILSLRNCRQTFSAPYTC